MQSIKLLCAAAFLCGSGPALADAAQVSAIRAAAPAIDKAMADFRLDSHAPGMVYGIVADGQFIHVRPLGIQDTRAKRPVNADSLFRIASMTKAFTALAILKLRDEGKLSLDDLAEQHVPEMRGWRYPTSDSPRIRIRDLLSHTAGFVTDNPWGDRQQPMPEEEFTRILAAGVPMSRPPGTAMEYSNFGYATLGRIVGNVSGVPYDDYVEREILKPLGMDSTGFEVAESPRDRRAIGYRWQDGAWVEEPEMAHGAFGAMGGLQTSANDYAKYVAWLLSAWPARDGSETGPLKRASIRELAEGSNFVGVGQRRGKSGANACRQASAYGKGMTATQDCDLGFALGHSGGYPGYGSYLLLLPDHGVGLFGFTNGTYNAPVGQLWDAAVALKGAGAMPGRTMAVTPLLAAAYRNAGAIFGAGDVMAARRGLAMNVLMDKSAKAWRDELAGLKAAVGACDTNSPVTPTGRMSGTFAWRCATGRIEGSVLLAPTPEPTIQELHYAIVEP